MALRNVLRLSFGQLQRNTINRTISIIPSRSSSYRSSEKFEGIEKHPEVEVIRNPPEWKYVEQLLGYNTIPKPLVKTEYPSGWTPPDPARYEKLPYFIERTKNYMLPVYLAISYRGMRRVTIVKFIEGNIWQLEQELNELITRRAEKRCFSQINEMNRQIRFKGDYKTLVEKYLLSKGL